MRRMCWRMHRALRVGAVVMLAAGGCAKDQGTALDREAFYRPPPGTNMQRHVLQDQPGALMYDNVRVDLLAPEQGVGVLRVRDEDDAGGERSVTAIAESVHESVRPGPRPATNAARGEEVPGPSTAPADVASAPLSDPPAGASEGVALTIGAVVCEVNGRPIYADKVLTRLAKVFAAEARRRNPRAFREYAEKEIKEEVRLLIDDEVTYAAARKNLDQREQDLANSYTMQWRARQISEAGGSIERARARAAAEGLTFEEMVEEEYRANIVRVYYQKRLFPRVQVRADDMRRYYDRNLRTLFTEQPRAQFRAIRIDADKTGGREEARRKIENLRQRALRGEDFAEMARTINDDPNLMRLAGDVGWVQRGAFAVEQVEEAVWALQPGQVSDVIEVGDSFYIARLENRDPGRVRPFEEEAVQKQIRKALENEMIVALRKRESEALRRDAIVYPDPPDISVVLDMAMQKYPQWASAR